MNVVEHYQLPSRMRIWVNAVNVKKIQNFMRRKNEKEEIVE